MKSSSLILSGNEIISRDIIRPQLCAFHTISPLCPSLQGTGSWTVSRGGEHRPCLGDLPQLPVEPLYGIGGVDELLALG